MGELRKQKERTKQFIGGEELKFIWSTIGQPHEHPNELPYENPIEHPFEYSINSVPIWTMMPISLFGAFRSSRNFGESSKIRFSSRVSLNESSKMVTGRLVKWETTKRR